MKENIPYFTLDKNYRIISCHNNAEKLFRILMHPDFLHDLFDGQDSENLNLPAIKNISGTGLFDIRLMFVRDGENINCFVIESGRNLPGHNAMNYQLREPVSGIFSLIPVIVDNINNDNPDKAVLYLEEVYRNSYRLLRSITNIRILDKIISDNTDKKSDVNFSSLLESIVHSVRTAVNDINIHCEIDEGISVRANPGILSTAVLNLISNSIIYRQEDSVNIIIKLENRTDKAIFTYSDNSKGIKEEYQQTVFEPYFAIDPYGDEGVNARLGLGLTIARAAFQQAGSNLLLTSEFGKGVKYTASLPVVNASELIFESKSSDFLLNRYSDVFIQLCDCCTLPAIR